MYKTTKLTIFLLSIVLLLTVGCNKKDSPAPPAQQTMYILKFKNVLGITGTATFTESSTTTTTIDILLNGKQSDLAGVHPAALCKNSEIEGGDTLFELNPVDDSGKSSTTVNMTYNDLIAFDGFIKVLKSATETNSILAQGDIGGNLITSTNKTYTLNAVGEFNKINGTAMFEKRLNGNTLVTISLDVNSTIPGDEYPATINYGTIESNELITKMTLNKVNGTTGKSYTTIRKLDNGTVKTYDEWMVYLGYINIYQTSVSLENIICQGNIGSNSPN